MGELFVATCDNCGNKFEVMLGQGFVSYVLHCDKCGQAKSILIEDLSEDWQSMDLVHYYLELERVAGLCICGGSYKVEAPPRCPKCFSSNWAFPEFKCIALWD